MKKISILFVCLGNICRSPIAEACFQYKVSKLGLSSCFEIDSAATSDWHAGENYHPQSQKICLENQTPTHGTSRSINLQDLKHFDYIFAMDHSNWENIRHLDKEGFYHNKIFHILEYGKKKHSEGMNVPDPYSKGKNAFQYVYELLDDSCEELLKYILEKHSIKVQTVDDSLG